MTSTLRGRRPTAPELPTGEVRLQAPPALERSEGASGVMMNAIPMLGSIGAIVLVASTGAAGGGARSYVAAGMFLLATLGFVAVQIDRQRSQRARSVTGARTAYLRHLADVRAVARRAAAQQRHALTWRHPPPAALPGLAAERTRVWERGPTDPSFLHVRFGTRRRPAAVRLLPPGDVPVDELDPAAVSALRRLLAAHRDQPDLPASLDLRAVDRLEVCGDEERARALVRALVCSAAAFHSPEHLVVAVVAHERRLVHWDWVKWLPHCRSRTRSDAVGPRRLVTTSPDELAHLLPPDLADRPRHGADERPAVPHVLLVVDGVPLPPDNPVVPPDGLHGVTVLDLSARGGAVEDPTHLRLSLLADDRHAEHPHTGEYAALEVVRPSAAPVPGHADQCDLATAEALARRLAPLSGSLLLATGAGAKADAVPGVSAEGPGSTGVMELLGLDDVRALDPDTAWLPRPARDRLRVPIGVAEDGAPVHLDLKESAQQGMGPHGLVVGATGAGKSELLRTLVLGLATTHSPEQLNLVLVDFKGGATFAGMAGLPHVSAVITNLSEELALVDRMQDALSGEMVRRQELLRAAGNHTSVRDYERARATGEGLEPLPSLFIVVDEFSELLSARPELVDLFVAIGRLGRSLGLHLLLASQRLEEGRLRGLESHLSYRIGLRTFSAQESRAVLGVPDAHALPAVPGLGYLKPDPTTMVRFTAAYVSGPAGGSPAEPAQEDGTRSRTILPFTISPVQVQERRPGSDEPPAPSQAPDPGTWPSLLDVAVSRMVGRGPAAHQVWLPPLGTPETLDALLGDLVEDPRLGLVSPAWRRRGGLTVPLGTVDRPREQRRDPLTADLSGAAGHVAVVGGPRSGTSTLLRTLVASTALVTTPLESQFFVLDLGGGAFAPMTGLPHVAGVATRSEPDVVRRVVAEVTGIVERRETYFRTHGIDSIETYRSRRREGRADDGYGDVFLVVDGWSTLRADFDDLETQLQQLAGRGLTFGLHVVAGAARWSDFRAAVRDVFGTRLELRLGDPADSEVDRRLAALVPADRPGRGLVPSGHHVLGALPRIDGRGEAATLGEGLESLVARVAAAWTGPAGPRLRLLPESVPLDDVRRLAGVTDTGTGTASRGGPLLFGVDEKELAPVALDPDAEQHLLVLGDRGSGKSTVLRTLLREVVRTRTPQQAQVLLVDHRRSLLGEVPEDHLLGYLTSAQQAAPALQDVAAYLERRLPGPEVTPRQLRERSWWQGAEVFVVVDDYDLVATQLGSPVAALQPLLAQARDVGLHLLMARRSGGASRALHEPVIQTLRDLATPGLMLSGDPAEGPLLGHLRPTPLVPGRGRLVSRDRGVEVVQTAWSEPWV